MPVQFSQEQRQNACKQHSQPLAGGKPASLHPASALQRQMGSKISATVQKTSSKVGSWGHCEGQQGRGGRKRLTFAQVKQEKIILLNTDVLVTFTLMWCSVGWIVPQPRIVPWARQTELKHCIQVLSNLRTSVSGDNLFFKLPSGFQEQVMLQLFYHMPSLAFVVWLQREDHRLEQEGEGIPLGTACPQPDVEWLGNHVLRKGK